MSVAFPRIIRSYARRERPLTAAAQGVYERLWGQFGIAEGDWDKLGCAERETVLDIGFGDGESLLNIAAEDRGRDYVGVEVYHTGIVKALRGIEEQGLTNVKLIEGDAQLVLGAVGAGRLAGLQVFFPDPWPKKRHHKRRLVQRPFLMEVVRVLKAGGTFHMATDWQAYADAVVESARSIPELELVAAERGGRPITRFERRGTRAGRAPFDIRYRKPS